VATEEGEDQWQDPVAAVAAVGAMVVAAVAGECTWEDALEGRIAAVVGDHIHSTSDHYMAAVAVRQGCPADNGMKGGKPYRSLSFVGNRPQNFASDHWWEVVLGCYDKSEAEELGIGYEAVNASHSYIHSDHTHPGKELVAVAYTVEMVVLG